MQSTNALTMYLNAYKNTSNILFQKNKYLTPTLKKKLVNSLLTFLVFPNL